MSGSAFTMHCFPPFLVVVAYLSTFQLIICFYLPYTLFDLPLICTVVRRAKLVGAQAAAQGNVYVTLKLQNVKSTTAPVKGPDPIWEQEFLL